MITVRFADVFLLILTFFVCVGGVYAIILMRRLKALAEDWQRTSAKIDGVVPDIQKLCTTTQETMASLKKLSDGGTRVVDDVADVTGEVRELAEEGMARLRGLMKALDTASLLVASFKAGLEAVRSARKEDGADDQDTQEETTHEEGNV